ncbi:hypothetical protein ACU4HD_03375 [Cupriavidus basilensis]
MPRSPGQYMLQWEQGQYDRTVVDIFGYHAVQLGLPHIDTLRGKPHAVAVSHWPLAPGSGPHSPRAQADAAPAAAAAST